MCAVSAARSASPHASTGTSSARGKTQPSKHAPATSASAASGHGRYLVVDNHNNK